MEGFRKMNKKKYDELDKRHDELIGEFTDLEWDIMWNLSSLIEINFDSDTLKAKIVSEMKSFHELNKEIGKIFDEKDFMRRCDKEGYTNKSDQWDKEEKEDFEK